MLTPACGSPAPCTWAGGGHGPFLQPGVGEPKNLVPSHRAPDDHVPPMIRNQRSLHRNFIFHKSQVQNIDGHFKKHSQIFNQEFTGIRVL